ncbi:hypothetical protein [Bradyrhizobium canariense]|uniref:Intracellular septation protein A n=1 Tax=Bradyrhizobium canariense TaxID=255045 RepID=A0A1H1MKN7_9BRAD|nr:hypothetical protein [Bradyrhizobium canariense]SDR87353.1 hypothetical protein SAMN05444158_0263 [Bradyrhizobium canariense]
MMVLLILAPFGAFAALMLVTSATVSLFAGAGVAAATIIYDVARGASIKMLAVGSLILFGALGGYIAFIDSSWSSPAVRLAVDGGVLAMALVSIAIRFPFTLQYAREIVDSETRKLPGFMHANYVITWAWTAAFVLMVLTNVLMIYLPSLPLWVGLAIALAARNGAALFTKWYPKHRREMAAKQPLPGGVISAS